MNALESNRRRIHGLNVTDERWKFVEETVKKAIQTDDI